MEKLIFCVKCKSLMTKIKPSARDILTTQKVLINNHPELTKLKSKGAMLLFNQ